MQDFLQKLSDSIEQFWKVHSIHSPYYNYY